MYQYDNDTYRPPPPLPPLFFAGGTFDGTSKNAGMSVSDESNQGPASGGWDLYTYDSVSRNSSLAVLNDDDENDVVRENNKNNNDDDDDMDITDEDFNNGCNIFSPKEGVNRLQKPYRPPTPATLPVRKNERQQQETQRDNYRNSPSLWSSSSSHLQQQQRQNQQQDDYFSPEMIIDEIKRGLLLATSSTNGQQESNAISLEDGTDQATNPLSNTVSTPTHSKKDSIDNTTAKKYLRISPFSSSPSSSIASSSQNRSSPRRIVSDLIVSKEIAKTLPPKSPRFPPSMESLTSRTLSTSSSSGQPPKPEDTEDEEGTTDILYQQKIPSSSLDSIPSLPKQLVTNRTSSTSRTSDSSHKSIGNPLDSNNSTAPSTVKKTESITPNRKEGLAAAAAARIINKSRRRGSNVVVAATNENNPKDYDQNSSPDGNPLDNSINSSQSITNNESSTTNDVKSNAPTKSSRSAFGINSPRRRRVRNLLTGNAAKNNTSTNNISPPSSPKRNDTELVQQTPPNTDKWGTEVTDKRGAIPNIRTSSKASPDSVTSKRLYDLSASPTKLSTGSRNVRITCNSTVIPVESPTKQSNTENGLSSGKKAIFRHGGTTTTTNPEYQGGDDKDGASTVSRPFISYFMATSIDQSNHTLEPLPSDSSQITFTNFPAILKNGSFQSLDGLSNSYPLIRKDASNKKQRSRGATGIAANSGRTRISSSGATVADDDATYRDDDTTILHVTDESLAVIERLKKSKNKAKQKIRRGETGSEYQNDNNPTNSNSGKQSSKTQQQSHGKIRGENETNQSDGIARGFPYDWFRLVTSGVCLPLDQSLPKATVPTTRHPKLSPDSVLHKFTKDMHQMNADSTTSIVDVDDPMSITASEQSKKELIKLKMELQQLRNGTTVGKSSNVTKKQQRPVGRSSSKTAYEESVGSNGTTSSLGSMSWGDKQSSEQSRPERADASTNKYGGNSIMAVKHVRFCKPLVTQVKYRPYTDIEDIPLLFFQEDELELFELDRETVPHDQYECIIAATSSLESSITPTIPNKTCDLKKAPVISKGRTTTNGSTTKDPIILVAHHQQNPSAHYRDDVWDDDESQLYAIRGPSTTTSRTTTTTISTSMSLLSSPSCSMASSYE